MIIINLQFQIYLIILLLKEFIEYQRGIEVVILKNCMLIPLYSLKLIIKI